jgi:hypothetical protein
MDFLEELIQPPPKPLLTINEDAIKVRYSYLREDKVNIIIELIRLLEPYLNSEHIINDMLVDYPPVKMKLDEEYYSSTIRNNTINEFAEKPLLYFTTQFNQALLHPIDRLIIMAVQQPNIFKFKLNTPIRLLLSNDINNVKIFNYLGEIINRKIQNYFLNIDNLEYTDENINKILNGNKNVRILFVIEAINYFIEYYKDRAFIINGYANSVDQNEIAITNFSNLVNRDYIIRYKYIKFVYKNENFIFSERDIRFEYYAKIKDGDRLGIYIESKSETGITKNMMTCPGKIAIIDKYNRYTETPREKEQEKEQEKEKEKQLKIYYRQFDDTTNNFVGDEIIFDCATTTYRDFYLNKYLKYKNKYLKLKSKVL